MMSEQIPERPRAARKLFPSDDGADAALVALERQLDEEQCIKYGFDFKNEKPIPGGRYVYQRVIPNPVAAGNLEETIAEGKQDNQETAEVVDEATTVEDVLEDTNQKEDQCDEEHSIPAK